MAAATNQTIQDTVDRPDNARSLIPKCAVAAALGWPCTIILCPSRGRQPDPLAPPGLDTKLHCGIPRPAPVENTTSNHADSRPLTARPAHTTRSPRTETR